MCCRFADVRFLGRGVDGRALGQCQYKGFVCQFPARMCFHGVSRSSFYGVNSNARFRLLGLVLNSPAELRTPPGDHITAKRLSNTVSKPPARSNRPEVRVPAQL